MPRTKQASKRTTRKEVVPVMGAVGVSLLAGSASAATAVPPENTPWRETGTPQITLNEEEIADVSLGTFYVFDKENAGTPRAGEQYARAAAAVAAEAAAAAGAAAVAPEPAAAAAAAEAAAGAVAAAASRGVLAAGVELGHFPITIIAGIMAGLTTFNPANCIVCLAGVDACAQQPAG